MRAERFSAKMNVATASSIELFCSAEIPDSIFDCLHGVDGDDDPSVAALQASTPFLLAFAVAEMSRLPASASFFEKNKSELPVHAFVPFMPRIWSLMRTDVQHAVLPQKRQLPTGEWVSPPAVICMQDHSIADLSTFNLRLFEGNDERLLGARNKTGSSGRGVDELATSAADAGDFLDAAGGILDGYGAILRSTSGSKF